MRRRPFTVVLLLLLSLLLSSGAALADAGQSVTLGFLPLTTRDLSKLIRGSAPKQSAVLILRNGTLIERVQTYQTMDVYNYELALVPGENRVTVLLEGTDVRAERVIYRTTASFSDLSGHWAQADIEILATYGIINGLGDGTFGPDGPLTRAQFAKLITLALDLEPKAAPGLLPFTDADAIAEWARGYIATAVEHGLIRGYEDGTFKPDAPVSRAEVAVIISRGIRQRQLHPEGQGVIFSDQEAIPVWARPDVDLATGAGIIDEYWGERFDASGQATRALAAAAVRRLKFAR